MIKDRIALKKNQKGLSLVELIVTIAIVAIVSVGIASFLITSYNQYHSQNSNINLQYEAQLAMNQLEDMILNASNGVSFDEASKTLTIYNQTEKTQADGTVVYENVISVVAWDSSTNQLKLSRYLYDPAGGSRTVISEDQLMADYVSAFSVKLDELETRHLVDVTLGFALDAKQYTATKEITIRNNIGRASDSTAFVAVHTTNPAVATNLQIKPDSMLVPRGTTAASGFSTAVQGENFPLQDVVWTLATTPDYPDTTVVNPSTGQLTIDGRETKTVFELQASTVTPSSSGAPITKSAFVYNVYADGITLSLSAVESETRGTANFSITGKNLTYGDVNASDIAFAFALDAEGKQALNSSDIKVLSGTLKKLDASDAVRGELHYSVEFELLDDSYMDQTIYCVAKNSAIGQSNPAEILFSSKKITDVRILVADSSGAEAGEDSGVYSLCRGETYQLGLEITYEDGTVEQVFAGTKKWENYDWSATIRGGDSLPLDDKGRIQIGDLSWKRTYTLNLEAASRIGGASYTASAQIPKVALSIVETGGVDQTAFPLCTNGGRKTITFRLAGINASDGYEVALSSGTPSHMNVSCSGMSATIWAKGQTNEGTDTLVFSLKKGSTSDFGVTTSITIVMGMPNLYSKNNNGDWYHRYARINNSIFLFEPSQISSYMTGTNGYYLLGDTGSGNAKLVSVSIVSGSGNSKIYKIGYGGNYYTWGSGGIVWNEFNNQYVDFSGWVKN